MKHYLFIITTLLGLNSASLAQQTIGKLEPNEDFTNQTGEVLFYMPRETAIELLNTETKAEFDSIRVEKYKLLVANMENRIIECDSAIGLRSLEADYWKMQLESNDRELEHVRIQNENLKYDIERIRKSRRYYVIGGIVATSIVYIAVK
jgi:hypothetical protein